MSTAPQVLTVEIPVGFNHGVICSDLVRRLARAQARGWRQEMLVTELLSSVVLINYESFAGQYYARYGEAKVTSKSYYGLRKRLISAGFVIKYVYVEPGHHRGLYMDFPEAGRG